MEYSLAIETSNAPTSIALLGGGELLGETFISDAKQTSAKIGLAVEGLLREHELSASQLTQLFVSIGPGSYTGLRVGLSFAKGLAYAQDIPITAVPSLKALAWGYLHGQQTQANYIVPAFYARRENVFCAIYDKELNVVLEPTRLSIQALYNKLLEYQNFDLVAPNVENINKIINFGSDSKVLDVRAFFVGKVGLTNKEKDSDKKSAYITPLYLVNNYI